MSKTKNAELAPVKVGQHITMACGCDRYAYEVVTVASPCRIIARQLKPIALHEGMTMHQNWKLESDPDGREKVFTFRRNRRWCEAGRSSAWWNGVTIHPVGETANYYMDPHF